MSIGWLVICLVMATLALTITVYAIRAVLKLTARKSIPPNAFPGEPAEPRAEPFPYASSPLRAHPEDYRIAPFLDGQHVYTIEEFFELMKKYSMDSDNGWAFWARDKGRMVHIPTGKDGRVNIYALRQGERPDPLFTHIEYLPK